MQSMNPDNVSLYYRQTGDPAGSVRLNEQKMQEYGRTALAGALLVAEGAAVSSEATITRGGTYRLVDDNTGQVMRTWTDICGFDIPEQEDKQVSTSAF